MTTIRLRRGSSAEWSAANPVLALGEPGYAYDTGVLKIGDGGTAWSSLPYFTATAGPLPSTAPSAPYTLGVQVGVPTGTPLTPTTGTPTPDATEDWDITHPVTGQTATITGVKVFRNRVWSTTFAPNPGVGETYGFENCRFTNTLDFFCVDVQETNGRADQMDPLCIFRRCDFDGNNTTGRCLNGPYSWVELCDMRNAEDAWGGAIYSVGIASNVVAGTDGGVDPHPDGVQISGSQDSTFSACWLSAGPDPGANSAYRAGTDFSAISNVQLYDCALRLGGYNLQVRGDPGGLGVDGVEVVRCVFGGWGFGYADFEDVINVTWTSNVDTDGNPLASPV